ncbi:hypothetical protein ebA2200 [Aromatoleum aromaticum EbN1]|uniref:Uncharacterized protein n=1 Tax=Aromatoleum aromaticum (strain DSM 19018 / LMG 30748 / EbN1) TaxID=76114 RepID=Q5P5S2_AROAE|nr:hypothetical protein ebA2200 [Aromatoleum aromaticum EbN1]
MNSGKLQGAIRLHGISVTRHAAYVRRYCRSSRRAALFNASSIDCSQSRAIALTTTSCVPTTFSLTSQRLSGLPASRSRSDRRTVAWGTSHDRRRSAKRRRASIAFLNRMPAARPDWTCTSISILLLGDDRATIVHIELPLKLNLT